VALSLLEMYEKGQIKVKCSPCGEFLYSLAKEEEQDGGIVVELEQLELD